MRRMIAALLCLMMMAGAAAESGPQYVENEWNFVENEMDVSQGIPDDAEGVLASIRDSGVLRVGTEPYFPPQEFIDPAKSGQDCYVGADMELARYIAQRMEVTLEIIPMEFTHVLDAVADGECDLVISALAYTPERADKVTLSRGYHYTGADANLGILLRAEDAAKVQSVDDLSGKNLVAQSGSLQEALLAQNVTVYREFRRVDSVKAVYDAVSGGTADIGAVDIESAEMYIRNNPDCGLALAGNIRFTLEPQFDGDRIAAKKGELQLMYFVNGVIGELLATGRYRQWFDEYEAYAATLEQE